MGKVSLIFKNAGIYTGFSFLRNVVGFFLIPLYTFYLSPTDFGILSIVLTVTGFLSVFYTFGINSFIIRYYSVYSNDKNTLHIFLGTSLVFIISIGVLLTVLLVLTKNLILIPILKGIDFYPYLLIGLLTVAFNPLFLISQTINQALHNARKYTIVNLFYFLINLFLVLCAVIYFKKGVLGILIAQLITAFIFFLYSLFTVFREIKFRVKKSILKKILTYSLPLIPHSLSGWTLDLIDRIFLNNLKSTAEVGVYNVGYKFGAIMEFFVNGVHQSFSPWFMENVKKENNDKFITKIAELIIVIYCFIAIGICFFGKDILMFMVSENFKDSWTILPFISFSYVIVGVYYFFGYSLFYDVKMTKYINIPTFSSAAINIILNIILIKSYGMIGAAIATLISYLVSSIITLYISNRINLIKFNYLKIYSIVTISFCFSLFIFIENRIEFFNVSIIKVILLLLIMIIGLILYRDPFVSFYKIIKYKFEK